MQELTFGDYVTLGISAVVLLAWVVMRIQRALNPHVGRQSQCPTAQEIRVNLSDIGKPPAGKTKSKGKK
ncbi:MAG: hypothetical protein HQL47_08145 [Gammaproteobacteria bacterium]|nr:hypothetical protein [Gammaproteobacteria bacterium]